jgi:hypothetical protein
LRPEIAKEIVRQAKLARLRSGAHIESAEDFHNAVEVSVDVVMHLPAFPDPLDRQAAYGNKSNWEERYTISPSDIKLAANRGVMVVTTAEPALQTERARTVTLHLHARRSRALSQPEEVESNG